MYWHLLILNFWYLPNSRLTTVNRHIIGFDIMWWQMTVNTNRTHNIVGGHKECYFPVFTSTTPINVHLIWYTIIINCSFLSVPMVAVMFFSHHRVISFLNSIWNVSCSVVCCQYIFLSLRKTNTTHLYAMCKNQTWIS